MERIHGAGAEVVAISVDDEVRQAGMSQRWALDDIRFVADPGGERFLQPLGLFDPEERGGLALPSMVIVSPDGDEVYRYLGRDFADRTNDDDLFEAVEALSLPAVSPEPWVPSVDVPDDLGRFLAPRDLGPYMRGNMFGAVAIGGRIEGDSPEAEAARDAARQHRRMAKATLDAWETWSPRVFAQ